MEPLISNANHQNEISLKIYDNILNQIECSKKEIGLNVVNYEGAFSFLELNIQYWDTTLLSPALF